MEKITNGSKKVIVNVYFDEGARHFSREFNSWSEANACAEYEVGERGAYKAEVHYPEVLTFTNDKNYLKKLRGGNV